MNTYNIEVIRGDTFHLNLGIETLFDAAATARMVFRAAQDDDAADLLVLTDTPAVYDDSALPALNWLVEFTATDAQTSALPPYDIVYFCELTTGTHTHRLVEGKARMRD